MDADLGDAVRVAEPDVLPGGAGVAAAVDAVAGQDVAADAGFAGADEDEVGVGFGHRDRADRGRGDLEVGDGVPVLAAVGGLPEAAAGGAEIGFEGAARYAGGGDGAAAAVGAQVAPPPVAPDTPSARLSNPLPQAQWCASPRWWRCRCP